MDPAVLWARAALLGSLVCLLGVAGHVTAGGELPGPVWLALLPAVSVPLCAPLLARPASALRLVVVLVTGQALVHLFLTTTAVAPDGHRAGSLQEHVDAGMAGGPNGPALDAVRVAGDVSAHLPMLALHLLAAVLVGLGLALAERALWTLVALGSAALVRPLLLAWALVHARAVAPVRDLVTVPAGPPVLRSSQRIARSVVRRGPPLLAAA
jgi:small-conductance mechanosensitive channel